MPVFDLVTLAELKGYLPQTGTVRDDHARNCISRASRALEHAGDQRYVYRAPAEVEGAKNLVNAQSWATGAIAAAAQPSAVGRTLIVSWTTATGGTLTATGTVAGVAGVTEVFDVANGLTQHGVKFFEGIVTWAAAAATGGGTVSAGSSLGYVEYHTPCRAAAFLGLLERPLRQVLLVNEDASNLYLAATDLKETTDYALVKSNGRLRRVSSSVEAAWLTGRRAVKVIYSAGYFGAANVPQDLKGIALKLATLLFWETEKDRFGLVTSAGPMGSYTRFAPATIGQDLYNELWAGGYVRAQLEPTGERDWDLEAA